MSVLIGGNGGRYEQFGIGGYFITLL